MLKKVLSTPGEWIAAVGVVLTLLAVVLTPKDWQPYSEIFGLSVLLGGTVTAITEIRARQERLVQQLTEMRTEVHNVSETAKAAITYGSAVSLISEALSRSQADLTRSHVRASGQALQHYALTVLRNRANALRSLEQGEGQVFELEEFNYINDFMKHLAEVLSTGSGHNFCASWLGVTHLTEGWLEDESEEGYIEFVRKVQSHSQDHRLTVLRIYAYHDEADLKRLGQHLDSEVRSGIVVKTLKLTPQGPNPPDLTLIWGPNPAIAIDQVRTSSQPVTMLARSGSLPICAMEFATLAGRMIRNLRVYAPQADRTSELQGYFAQAWKAADGYEASRQVSA